jgi:ATP-dependent Lhr-like helicase
LGRRAALWHGDVPTSARRRLAGDPPDLLLTTPESLEAVLVSRTVDAGRLFAGVRAVVVDEVHAFAGDDRGWHLLAVLERVARLAGRPLQRVGLSATVGNPGELLVWLQGAARDRPATVVAPPVDTATVPDLQLDYVGSVPNAAKVLAALHAGEKRLVFAESRRTVEALAVALRGAGVETFVSHSSLALDERRRAETAFAESRDCVIVATSTLELGVDVGDLDRVVQVGSPRTVASFLQRLGRTGRRAGSTRNALFLATDDDELLRAASLLRLHGEGYVEPVVPPPTPRHLLAQQLLGLCLERGQVGEATWPDALGGLPLGEPGDAERVAGWLLETGHLDRDGGLLFVGPEAERRYGRRHFLELLSVFTAPSQFLVLHGRTEVGAVDPVVLTRKAEGPRVLALAGRPWQVTHVDWGRRRVWVEPGERAGSARWSGAGQPLSAALTGGMRRVLLGADPARVRLSRRAGERLARLRAELGGLVDPEATVVDTASGSPRWWTWAGGRANALLAEALDAVAPGIVEPGERFDDRYLRLTGQVGAGHLRAALSDARRRYGDALAGVEPAVSEEAVRALKFADLLPPDLAHATLAARLGDHAGAGPVLRHPVLSRT